MNCNKYYESLSPKTGEIGILSSLAKLPFDYKELGKANIDKFEITMYDAGNDQVGVHIDGLSNVDLVFSADGLLLDYYQSF